MGVRISSGNIVIIRDWYLAPGCSIAELSRRTGLGWQTIATCRDKLKEIERVDPERVRTVTYFKKKKPDKKPSLQYLELMALLPVLISGSALRRNSAAKLWKAYRMIHPDGYSYPGFKLVFAKWRELNKSGPFAHLNVKSIPEADGLVFARWRKGDDHRKWCKAVVITGSAAGLTVNELSDKTDIGMPSLLKWIGRYNAEGMAGLDKRPLAKTPPYTLRKEERRGRVMALLHETPKQYGYNRTAWKRVHLADAYQKIYGEAISTTAISDYIKEAGYKFKKAKMVLTSPDPRFREKVNWIKTILGGLRPGERFFFMDEFGPFAIKMKPGWEYTAADHVKTIPQIQKSKGWSICTAALEMSTNQVTHFYSRHKNSEELIKLVNLLLSQYPEAKTLYISGDAARWHRSAALREFQARVNTQATLNRNATAFIEFAWLPSSAQFLNVIESVFSGLCRAVLHNSDYTSVAECQAAIDLYFLERNAHFKKDPKRAGDKIWGREVVKPVFDEGHNCKDAGAASWLYKDDVR